MNLSRPSVLFSISWLARSDLFHKTMGIKFCIFLQPPYFLSWTSLSQLCDRLRGQVRGSGGRDITDDGDYCKVICQANGGCSVEVSAAKNSVQLTNFDCIVEWSVLRLEHQLSFLESYFETKRFLMSCTVSAGLKRFWNGRNTISQATFSLGATFLHWFLKFLILRKSRLIKKYVIERVWRWF